MTAPVEHSAVLLNEDDGQHLHCYGCGWDESLGDAPTMNDAADAWKRHNGEVPPAVNITGIDLTGPAGDVANALKAAYLDAYRDYDPASDGGTRVNAFIGQTITGDGA